MSLRKINIVALICLASVTLVAGACQAKPESRNYHFGVWKLRYIHDKFDGSNICSLSGKKMAYKYGVVSFRLGKDFVGQDAAFKVNNGEVHKFSEYDSEMRSQLIYNDPGPLDDPFGGSVSLPVSPLLDASILEIRPSAGAKVSRFNMRGFGDAVSFMRSHNCQ